MNRAEGRRKYRADLKPFHQATKGAFQGTIVKREEFADLMIAGTNGDATAVATVRSNRRLAQQRHHYERSEASLCLDCDTSFVDGVLPEAFAVVTPFAASGHALVSGICSACVARCGDDLMAATAQRWRIIWPDLRIIEGGNG